MRQEIKVLDHGYVRYVDHLGDDLRPLEAARVSTGNPTGVDEAKDDKLRTYLWKHGHLSPFEMCVLGVEIQAPIFVARQVFRHRSFSFNEFSARYAEMPELFYQPAEWRAQGDGNKQGSSGGVPFAETKTHMIEYDQEVGRAARAALGLPSEEGDHPTELTFATGMALYPQAVKEMQCVYDELLAVS